jgi:hypothetical protein
MKKNRTDVSSEEQRLIDRYEALKQLRQDMKMKLVRDSDDFSISSSVSERVAVDTNSPLTGSANIKLQLVEKNSAEKQKLKRRRLSKLGNEYHELDRMSSSQSVDTPVLDSPAFQSPSLPPSITLKPEILGAISGGETSAEESNFFPGAVSSPGMLQHIKDLVRNFCQRDLEDLCQILQPSTLTMDDLASINRQRYVVGWAPSYPVSLLVILQSGVYILQTNDSTLTPYRISHFRIPQRRTPSVFLDRTIAVGHLVVDDVENQKIHRFLITDLILIEGNYLWEHALNKRLNMAKIEIVNIVKKLAMESHIKPAVSLRIMNIFTLDQISNVLSIMTRISHPNDGFQFYFTFEKQETPLPKVMLRWSESEDNGVSKDTIVNLCKSFSESSGEAPSQLGSDVSSLSEEVDSVSSSK